MPRPYEGWVVQADRGITVAANTAMEFEHITAGIHINGPGTVLIVTLADDATPTRFTVVPGVVYPYAIKSVESSNEAAIVALFNGYDS